MTHEEVIKALKRALDMGGTPVGECFDTILPRPVLEVALCLIESQQEVNLLLQAKYTQMVKAERAATLRLVSEAIKNIICEHTYPDFDKDGKPVNVWKAKEGYAAIDEFVKTLHECIESHYKEDTHERNEETQPGIETGEG